MHNMKNFRQPFEFYLVMDLECTCEQDNRHYPNEIIEFPVILIDSRTLQILSEFHRFVKPVINPILSPFCQKLTGITQNVVDQAQTFPLVLQEFEEWLFQQIRESNTFCFITDGIWDITKFLSFEFSKLREYYDWDWVHRMESLFATWIDCRQLFQHFYGYRPRGIEGMLSQWNLEFRGRPHRGIDDSRNIASIVIKMMQEGCIFYPTADYYVDNSTHILQIMASDDRSGDSGDSRKGGDVLSDRDDSNYCDENDENDENDDESDDSIHEENSLLLIQVIREIKRINKTLSCDKKYNRFSSHNKYQVYYLRGTLQQVKSLIPTIKLTPSSIVSLPNDAHLPPLIKFTIQTLKRTNFSMELNGLGIVQELEYEENPFNGHEFVVSQESKLCSFIKASFVGTLEQIKCAIATLKRGEEKESSNSNRGRGGASTLILCFYLSKDYQLQTHFPWSSHTDKNNFSWVDITAKHDHKQSSNSIKMVLTLDKLLKMNPTLAPPSDQNDETLWRAWRLSLIQRKKELQKLKSHLTKKNGYMRRSLLSSHSPLQWENEFVNSQSLATSDLRTRSTRIAPSSNFKSGRSSSSLSPTISSPSLYQAHYHQQHQHRPPQHDQHHPSSCHQFHHHYSSPSFFSKRKQNQSMSPNYKPKFFPSSPSKFYRKVE